MPIRAGARPARRSQGGGCRAPGPCPIRVTMCPTVTQWTSRSSPADSGAKLVRHAVISPHRKPASSRSFGTRAGGTARTGAPELPTLWRRSPASSPADDGAGLPEMGPALVGPRGLHQLATDVDVAGLGDVAWMGSLPAGVLDSDKTHETHEGRGSGDAPPVADLGGEGGSPQVRPPPGPRGGGRSRRTVPCRSTGGRPRPHGEQAASRGSTTAR
jgi:hypothetical protein